MKHKCIFKSLNYFKGPDIGFGVSKITAMGMSAGLDQYAVNNSSLVENVSQFIECIPGLLWCIVCHNSLTCSKKSLKYYQNQYIFFT